MATTLHRTKKQRKKVPVCTRKDLRKRKAKRRKCRVVRAPRRTSPTGFLTAPPAASSGKDAFPTAPSAPLTDGLRAYIGPFGVEQATRLLFRAGFGPRPGQAEALAAAGLEGAVQQLINPGEPRLEGPEPSGAYLVGGQFAPADRYGHLHLATMDRQVRSTDSLGERMTLVLHDWFAVSDGGAERQFVPAHLDLLRRGWRGSFRQLLLDVTHDPAMLQFLDGVSNRRGAPNENFARELMELYTLGADRGAYTEADVREMARAFTGFRNDYSPSTGAYNFRFDPALFDNGVKTIFRGTPQERTGRLDWQDGVTAVVDHPLHPSFVVRKLWSYFIPTAPTPVTQQQLEALYRRSGEQLLPLVEAILLHPDLHQGPAMVKPPVVYASGLLRATGQGIATDAWAYYLDSAGQMIGRPPNVSGWNDQAWLNTSTHAARWTIARAVIQPSAVSGPQYAGKTEAPADALDTALRALGNPPLSAGHLAAVRRVAQTTWAPGTPGEYGTLQSFLAQRQNTLRQLIAAAPDSQVS